MINDQVEVVFTRQWQISKKKTKNKKTPKPHIQSCKNCVHLNRFLQASTYGKNMLLALIIKV